MYTEPPIIQELSPVLREPIPRAGEDLEVLIIRLEAFRLPLAEAVRQHSKFLYEKRKQMLWPKDAEKGMTELDRNIRLLGDLSEVESNQDFLVKLDQLVEQKIALAASLIR